jgi:hypothetical protein
MRQQPGQRDLARTGAVAARDLVDRRPVAGDVVSAGDRRPREEREPLLGAFAQDVLGGAIDDVVTVLDGDDRDDLLGALKILEANVGEADVTDLALLLELGEGA